ncbi:MAG: response regulator [Dehalococcoidia bacterium]
MAKLMTLEEVADYLRVTKRTIYRLLDKHTIPSTKVGHQWRFDKAAIDVWLSQSSPEAAAKILVIDDDETICSLFRDTLEEAGHTIATASESLKGLELIKGQDYDLVLLDLKMPEIDGAELFKQIRKSKPGLPVIIITGYPDSDLMMEALTYGPFGVMKKPFNDSDILSAVNNYLRFGRQNK